MTGFAGIECCLFGTIENANALRTRLQEMGAVEEELEEKQTFLLSQIEGTDSGGAMVCTVQDGQSSYATLKFGRIDT